jgi:hypothetical protein
MPSVLPLDELVRLLSTPSTPLAAQKAAASALGSVAAHPHAKMVLHRSDAAVEALCRGILRLALLSPGARWEALSLLGELCRREHREDAGGAAGRANAVHVNSLARSFVMRLCRVTGPSVYEVLDAILSPETAEADEEVAAVASDIKRALPVPISDGAVLSAAMAMKDGAGTSSAASEAGGEAVRDAVDRAILDHWTKDRRERCKDLMFLDARAHGVLGASGVPLVARASAVCCAGCGGGNLTLTPSPASSSDAVPKAGPSSSTATVSAGAPLKQCSSCRAVWYCGAECQKAHWVAGHRGPCQLVRAAFARSPGEIKSGSAFRSTEGALTAFGVLFYESRAFQYAQRGEALRGVGFDEYFMQFAAGA